MNRGWQSAPGVFLLVSCLGLWSCTTGPQPQPAPPEHPSITQPAPQATPPSSLPQVNEPQQPLLAGTVVRVIDGDTIEVQLSSGPIRVRLNSIDTPEKDQPWGPEAAAALASRVDGQRVMLDVITQDQYDRLVAIVYLGDQSINAWMVQQGNAWAYRQYLNDATYCVWEGNARAAKLGLWSLPPDSHRAPWEWRAAERGSTRTFTDFSNETVANCIAAMHRQVRAAGVAASVPYAVAAVPRPPGACLIKGNISNAGRIYHVPGSAYYEVTRIDEAKGERWFCTEAQARAEGWRAPKD
jgi:endonuclease YncB( thermonuclease family)